MYLILGMVLGSLVSLGDAWGRDTSKTFKSLPTISNSLVNFGKMDISFHFNAKGGESPAAIMKADHMHSMSPYYTTPYNSKSDGEIEPCPCSSLKNFKNPFLTNPSDILNKILRSNDLFSYNQDQVISTSCCDSHEHVQEEAVFFEFNPRVQPESASFQTSFPNPTQFPFKEMFFPRAPISGVTNKPKAIEIFFFPKKKDTISSVFEFPKLAKKKDFIKKSDIQVVGDKELKNEFKNYKIKATDSVDIKDDVQEKTKPEYKTITEEVQEKAKTEIKSITEKYELTKIPLETTQSSNSL